MPCSYMFLQDIVLLRTLIIVGGRWCIDIVGSRHALINIYW